MAPVTQQRLPDPHGLIGRIRARLNKKCAIRVSPFCDYIISMRMQGIPFRDIEAWLIEQGDQYRISAATIWRNFKQSKIEVKLTYAEEMLEKMGGVINLDLVREMSQNIITQKQRVDRLVRGEENRRKQAGSENYVDKRIRQEMQLMNDMIAKLHSMLEKAPGDAAAAAEEELRRMDQAGIGITEDAASLLTDMILNNEISVGAHDLLGSTKTRH